MTAPTPSEPTLALSASERDFLVDLLRTVLKDSRIEEHRTRTPSFRTLIVEREKMIASLLQKLGAPAE
jgi:hypothetical protein